jgi:Uma2 family endonuclease
MAATAARTLISVEEYLHSSIDYEPDAEYVDGEIEERPMGQYDHAAWQEALILWFRSHAREWSIRVKPEYRVKVSPTRFRVPDVTVFPRDLVKENVLTHPPIAVFEILSPEDTMTRVLRKLNDYEAMGIPHIWVIDPENGQSYVFREKQLKTATTFGEPGDPIHFPISEIESLLD